MGKAGGDGHQIARAHGAVDEIVHIFSPTGSIGKFRRIVGGQRVIVLFTVEIGGDKPGHERIPGAHRIQRLRVDLEGLFGIEVFSVIEMCIRDRLYTPAI